MVLPCQMLYRCRKAVPAKELAPQVPSTCQAGLRGHLGAGDSVAVPPAVVTTTAGAGWLLLLCLP